MRTWRDYIIARAWVRLIHEGILLLLPTEDGVCVSVSSDPDVHTGVLFYHQPLWFMESEVTCDKPPPCWTRTGVPFLFLGAEWRHIKVSRSTTLTRQKKSRSENRSGECLFEKSLFRQALAAYSNFFTSAKHFCLFFFFFFLLIFAIFSHDFITNWKKRGRNAGSKSAARCPQKPADLCALIKIVHCFSTKACPSGGPLNKWIKIHFSCKSDSEPRATFHHNHRGI